MSSGTNEAAREERESNELKTAVAELVRALEPYYDAAFGWSSQDAIDYINEEVAQYGLVLGKR